MGQNKVMWPHLGHARNLFTFHTVVQMSPEELQGWKKPEFLNDFWGGEPPIFQEHPF